MNLIQLLRRLLLVALAASIAFTLVACNGAIPASGSSDPTPTPTASEEPKESELTEEEQAAILDMQEIMKYNAYIDMSNAIGGRFSDAINRYEKYYGLEEDMRTDNPMSLYTVSEAHQKAYTSATSAAGDEPSMPELDAAVKALAPKVIDICKLLNDMESYYELKNYVDDGFEKGKEYHAALVEKLDGIYGDLDDFYLYLSELQIDMQEKGETRLMEDGKLIQYQTLQIINHAKALSGYLSANSLDNTNVETADIEEFKLYYDALAQSVNDWMELCKDETQMEAEKDFAKHRWFSSLKRAVEDVKKTATTMLELIQEGKQVGLSGSGSPSELSEKADELVRYYNDIISDLN